MNRDNLRDCATCRYLERFYKQHPCNKCICYNSKPLWEPIKQFVVPKIKTKLINTTDPIFLPSRKYPKDAGADLRANIGFNISINSGGMLKIPTGVSMEIPEGHVGIVTARSGATTEGKVTLVGIIDSDYRGEIGLNVVNMGKGWAEIIHGERLAQIVIVPVFLAEFEQVDELGESERGKNGFGSTGRV